MALQKIDIVEEFAIPVAELFRFMSEHENLNAVFAPAQVKRLRDGDAERNGVGSVRSLGALGQVALEETITGYIENELIEYRITKGGPLKSHHGVIRFYPFNEGSRLHYTITFEGKVPFVAEIMKPVLETTIRRGLKSVY